jgi:DNA end-binding protein Ku
MAARAIGSGTVSFGLVSIPVKLYVATSSKQLSFNLLHAECGSRIRQQLSCPRDERVVTRDELVKGYEFAKDRYVTFSDEELKALEAAANAAIEIHEFVPLDKVDPIYFENAHYLGPDKGGEKAYQLLADVMRQTGLVALTQYVSHGKEHLGLIRPLKRGLVLHAMYYADEVRDPTEIGADADGKFKASERDLARKLVEQLSSDEFHPERYQDDYRARVEAIVEKKVAGEEITASESQPGQAQVIDLMDALKQSLARRTGKAHAAATPETTGKRRPAARAQGRSARSPRRMQKK